MIGGQVGIAGHLTIGNVRIQAIRCRKRILKMMKFCKKSTFGYNDFSKSYVYFKNLPKYLQN
jgi:UDP-3-O-[3-hydroxymyristoyl] glucosamine N-acyltransferase